MPDRPAVLKDPVVYWNTALVCNLWGEVAQPIKSYKVKRERGGDVHEAKGLQHGAVSLSADET